jgi:hypothetical protein
MQPTYRLCYTRQEGAIKMPNSFDPHRDRSESTTITIVEIGKVVHKATGPTPSTVMTASAGELGAQPRG